MNPFNFVSYMETIATTLKDILHTTDEPRFHKISSIAKLEELLQAAGETKGIQLLVVDNREGRLIDNGAEALFDDRYYIFYLVQNIEISEMDERNTTLDNLKLTAKKILSKMFKDRQEDGSKILADRTGLYDMDRNSVTYLTVGPFGDNYQGIQVSFTIAETFSYVYSAADWN